MTLIAMNAGLTSSTSASAVPCPAETNGRSSVRLTTIRSGLEGSVRHLMRLSLIIPRLRLVLRLTLQVA